MKLPGVCDNSVPKVIDMHGYRQRILFFVICVCLFSQIYASETIYGKITAVGNGQVIVEIDALLAGQAYPAEGDEVMFFVEIIGLDESVNAGEGIVLSVNGEAVTVRSSGNTPPLEASAKINATGTLQASGKEPDISVADSGHGAPPIQPQTTPEIPLPEPQNVPLEELDEASLLREAENGDSEAMFLLGKKLDVSFGLFDKDSRFDLDKHPQRDALEWYKKSLAVKQTDHVTEAYLALDSRRFRVGRFEMIAPPGFQIARTPVGTILELKLNHADWSEDVLISMILITAKKPPRNAEKHLEKVRKKARKGQQKLFKGKDVELSELDIRTFYNGEFLVTGISSFLENSAKPGPLLHIIYLDLRNGDIYHFISQSLKESLYSGSYWSDYIKASMLIYD